MMHAFMKALYASGEQHSPTCWPAVMPLPADMSMYNQQLEAFARPAGTHNLHQPHYITTAMFSPVVLACKICPSRRAHRGQLAV